MKCCAKERARCSVKAVEAEVTAYIQAHQHEVDEDGRRLVVRNGHARERTLVSGAGQLKIQAPRVDDRRVDERGQRFRFTSQILPPYLRRTKSVEELIPWLSPRELLMFAKYSVGAQRAAPALARHLLCPKTTLYSAGITANVLNKLPQSISN